MPSLTRRCVCPLALSQLSPRGKFEPQADAKSYQVMTTSADGQIIVWDIRFEEKAAGFGGRRNSQVDASLLLGAPPPVAELAWLPVYKCTLRGSGQSKCGVARFALNSAVRWRDVSPSLTHTHIHACTSPFTHMHTSAAGLLPLSLSSSCVSPSCTEVLSPLTQIASVPPIHLCLSPIARVAVSCRHAFARAACRRAASASPT